ncbi:MAG: hypothetical protein PW786_13775 [Arachidicoccus sp.]|nr:hypothetical protein [Arachidicoccus sp.]
MLTEEQIKTLQNYCNAKGVVYYDLEQEIIDHLASVIETEQAKFPNKSFEKILQTKAEEFSADWRTIETEKRKALRREYLRKFGKEFMSYFKLPRLIIIILSIVILFAEILNTKQLCYIFYITTFLFVPRLTKTEDFLKYLKKKRSNNLLIFNILQKIFLITTILFFTYTFSIPIIYKFYSEKYGEILMRIFLLASIFYYSSIIVLKTMLQKMQIDYPLAFQN